MLIPEFAPPLTAPEAVVETVRQRGFAVLGPTFSSRLAGVSPAALLALRADWEQMPVDPHLKDGGQYRRRRHASFVIEDGACRRAPHRAHYQPPEYNALHGGLERWFEPMHDDLVATPAWQALLTGLSGVCSALRPARRWFVEAHQFRIDTSHGIGRPTPEGAHRDGVDFVAVFLIDRARIRGGETRVFDAQQPEGQRFTLREPWSVLFLDDARMIHETTPIQPELAPGEAQGGHRDTLVLTFRRDGFQEP